MIILIGGGSRSGKTRFALDIARRHGKRLAYIATAQLLDEEMNQRAAAHRHERGPEFDTIEEPIQLANALTSVNHEAIVIDCLTLWLSNLMLATPPFDIEHETTVLLNTAVAADSSIIFITNEVGCGIVPENELARRFRDAAGYLNQKAAASAREAYFLAFGCPIRLK